MMNGYAHVFELQMKYYRCALEKSGFQRTVRGQVEVVVVDGTRKDIGFLFLKNVDVTLRNVTSNSCLIVVTMNHERVENEIGSQGIGGLDIAKLTEGWLRPRRS